MKKNYINTVSSVSIIILFAMQLMLAGCQKTVTAEKDEVIFYPPAPEKARLQFLKSFTAIEDLGGKGPSSFESFMWGAPQRRDMILKPYGVAMDDGKLYVCDIGRSAIEVFDVRNQKFYLLSQERRMRTPMNIFIDNGVKYVSDPKGGAI
ncbi:MAG: hypothetical protein KAS23_11785, partial [Anaerohalosphaera sp.]|nr:hypothetical protein [Anaerohalosphaera sp.]